MIIRLTHCDGGRTDGRLGCSPSRCRHHGGGREERERVYLPASGIFLHNTIWGLTLPAGGFFSIRRRLDRTTSRNFSCVRAPAQALAGPAVWASLREPLAPVEDRHSRSWFSKFFRVACRRKSHTELSALPPTLSFFFFVHVSCHADSDPCAWARHSSRDAAVLSAAPLWVGLAARS